MVPQQARCAPVSTAARDLHQEHRGAQKVQRHEIAQEQLKQPLQPWPTVRLGVIGPAFCMWCEAVAIRTGSDWPTGSGNEDRQTNTTAGHSVSLGPVWLSILCSVAVFDSSDV